MAKMQCRILDARYSGFSFEPRPPAVVPVEALYKWRPWQNPEYLWAVVQPQREVVGASVEWVWRHIAVFRTKEDADEFLSRLPA